MSGQERLRQALELTDLVVAIHVVVPADEPRLQRLAERLRNAGLYDRRYIERWVTQLGLGAEWDQALALEHQNKESV